MAGVVLVKLGGSLITDKGRSETARVPVIARLAREISLAPRGLRLIVAHGSGSFGHVPAKAHGLAAGLHSADQLSGVSLTQERAAYLHLLVFTALSAAGAAPFSIAPSSVVVSEGGTPVSLEVEPLLLALERGLLPLAYGDVVMDRTQGVAICSTEKLFSLLVATLRERGHPVERILWLGETDGVYDATGWTIPLITAADFEQMRGALGGAAGTDVTGGMLHRVETAVALTELGVPSLIANGLTEGLLARALAGEEVPGTVVRP